jgi:polyphosphate kinase
MKVKHKIPESSGLFPESAFTHRELSLLTFFERVLYSARQDNTPLLERLRFLTICSAILDEFFEIRVAGLKERQRLNIDRIGPDKLSTGDVLSQIRQRVLKLTKQQYHSLNDEVLPALSNQGIIILKRSDWRKKQREWSKRYFVEQVAPVLTPVALDPAHPFPRLLNKSLNMLIALDGTDAFGRTCDYAVLHVPRCLPRVIPVPVSARAVKDREEFVLLSSLIHAHVSEVFPEITVKGCHQFRVTRHADLEVDEDEIDDLLDALKGELHDRRYGECVRLEVANTCPDEHVNFLLEHFKLSHEDLYRVRGPVNLNRLATVVGIVDRPDLKYPVFVPGAIFNGEDMFEKLQRRDLLLHHPFESFSPVVNLVVQAASDPNVLAIKHTLYRTGNKSPFVDALAEAARVGKEVTAVIELRARFDEAANINIASRLQAAGVHVVYGVVGFKTHAKLLMIVRREGEQLRRYVHIGTGNYHTGNARAYTDFSLLTARQDLGRDVHQVFQQLTGIGSAVKLNHIIQAPFHFASQITTLLEAEAEEARAGRPALAVIKVNSLSDPSIIEALYSASQAGVKIHLIVRGICCLKPGIEGVSDHITVRSIVGRFLEHTRVYYFYAQGKEQVFLASADLMQRNLYRRVEVGFPVQEPNLKERVIKEGLQSYLESTLNTWAMQTEGIYLALPEPCFDLAELSYLDAQSSDQEAEAAQSETQTDEQAPEEETRTLHLRPRITQPDASISAQMWLLSQLTSN